MRNVLLDKLSPAYLLANGHLLENNPTQQWWLLGRVLDLRLKGLWFETHLRHWVVSLTEQDTLSSAL